MTTTAPARAVLDKRTAGALGVVIVAGLCLRVFDLGAKSLWLDELLSLNHAREIAGWASFFAPGSGDAHPPMYFLLLKGWLRIASGDTWARGLSVLLGTATIPATFVLARQFFSTRVSLVSSALVAFSPFLLLYDREIRNYPLFTLLSVLSLWCFIRALREGRTADWAAYATLTALNTYTHYHAFLLVGGEVAFAALRARSYRARVGALVVSLAAIGLCYAPMLSTLLEHLSFVGDLEARGGRFPVILGYWVRPAYVGFALALGQTLLPWKPLALAGGAAALALLAFAVRRLRLDPEALCFLATCLVLPIVGGTLVSDPMPRYYLFVAPLFYMLLASGIVAVPRRPARWALGMVLAVAWGTGIANYYANREFHVLAHVDPWRDAGRLLKADVRPGDVVVQVAFTLPIPTGPLEYAAGFPIASRGEGIVTDLPQLTRDGTAPRVWLAVSESTLQQAGRDAAAWLGKRYTLCTEHRYRHDPDYAFKKQFFRKDFAEYRIRVYRFEEPRHGASGSATCRVVLDDQE